VTPRCAQLHPGTEPRMSQQRSGWVDRNGNRRVRDVCLECKLAHEIARKKRLRYAPAAGMPSVPQPYGVIPLAWPPPRL